MNFLCYGPEYSGSPPRRAPPPLPPVYTPSLIMPSLSKSQFLQSTHHRELSVDDIDDFEDDDYNEEVDSLRVSRGLRDEASDVAVSLPSFTTGITDDDLRETAYELLASTGASGGLVVPPKEKKEDKKSRLMRKLARSKSDYVAPQSERASGLTGLLKTMRVRLEGFYGKLSSMLVGMTQHLIWFGRSRQLHTFLRTLRLRSLSKKRKMFAMRNIVCALVVLSLLTLIYLFLTLDRRHVSVFSYRNNDLIEEGLPGQPLNVSFKQYAGNIIVDELKGRSLFYYFVEAADPDPTTNPTILWLNGGRGFSSVGNGAFVEIGPFGVQRDGMTLYSRQHSWNKAKDNYAFLRKWVIKYPEYRNTDFHIAGESYAGIYIPRLADLILMNNMHLGSSSRIQLKGIMIGNGMMNFETDKRGMYEYFWSRTMISTQTYHGLIDNCIDFKTIKCSSFQRKAALEMGDINAYDIYSPYCQSNSSQHGVNVCEKDLVKMYMNLHEAQHANITNLPYSWGLCSSVLRWSGGQSSMLPMYRRLIGARL